MSPLRRRIIEDMTIRNLSPATQRSYLHAVSKFSQYFGHSPDRLGLEEVRAYQVHLGLEGHFLGFAKSDCLRAAVLLWGDARPRRKTPLDPRRHPKSGIAPGRQPGGSAPQAPGCATPVSSAGRSAAGPNAALKLTFESPDGGRPKWLPTTGRRRSKASGGDKALYHHRRIFRPK